MDPVKIKLTKVRESDDHLHPNNIPEGNEYIGTMHSEPKAGECFYLDRGPVYYFRTSEVQEVIDETTFRTFNSIYQIERI